MVKVKALFHFLDKKACRNRMQGDIFTAPDDWAEELAKAGLVEPVEAKNEADKNTNSKVSEPHKERAKTAKNQKK